VRPVGVVLAVAFAIAVVSIPATARARCKVRLEATTGAGTWGFVGDRHGGADGIGLELGVLYAPRCGIAVVGARALLLLGVTYELQETDGQREQEKAALDLAPVVGLSIPIWRIGLMATAGPALTSLREHRGGESSQMIGVAVDAAVRMRLVGNFWLGARVAENFNEVRNAQAWLLEFNGIADL
jgi:hypothetical protein